MKKNYRNFILAVFFLSVCCVFPGWSQTPDSTGLPGDHFSLEATLELFKESESLEDFEKKLNQEDNGVNNLDLNEDGEIDYIRVEDHTDGNVHAIALQALLGENEVQDVAVIEIEKTGDESAILQILGDEDVYGEATIVEPFEEQATQEGKGPNADVYLARVVVNVWGWSSVRFVYRPGYRVYVSPWRWGYYPGWWSPWRPRPWRTFWNRTVVYRGFYRPVTVHRVTRAHVVYTPKRKTSVTVRTRTTTIKSRRTVNVNTSGNGKKVAVSRTTSTTVRSNGNKVAAKQTQQKVGVKSDGNGNVKVGTRTQTRAGATNGNQAVGKNKTSKATVSKKGKTKTVKKQKTKTVKRKKKN